MSTQKKQTVLVVGATGQTGHRVVQLLLNQGHTVKAVVRSPQRLQDLLKPEMDLTNLHLTQASLLDLSKDQLQELVKDANAVVSCLGHTMDAKGLWGNPKYLVRDAVQRLSHAIVATSNKTKPTKLIVMSSTGVGHPDDDPRPFLEKTVLFLCRHLMNPHKDNEQAAQYLLEDISTTTPQIEWCAVRPDDLIDEDQVTEVTYLEKPKEGLFGAHVTSRINVAQSMVQLVVQDDLWNRWKFHMPVVINTPTNEAVTE